MKTKINLLLIILISANSFITKAQDKTDSEKFILKTQSYSDSIVLRWVPKDLTSWRTMITDGITIVRTHIRTGEKIVLTPKEIRPYNLEEWKTKTDTTNIFVATAAQCLLGTGKVTKEIANQQFSSTLLASKEQHNTLAFAAMSADFSVQAANGLAFRWVDSDVQPHESYQYELHMAGQKVSNSYIQRTNNAWQASKVINVELKEETNKITISWPKAANNTRFSGYYVERKTNESEFKRVSKSIIKATLGTLYSSNHQYIDSDVAVNNTYSYRVIGITSFADIGLFSEVVKGTPQPSISTPIPELWVTSIKNTEVTLSWEQPKSVEFIQGYHVLRSKTKLGTPAIITPTLLSANTTTFKDTTVKEGATYFYSIQRIEKNGETATTTSKPVIIPDNTPPKSPIGLIGEIDSLGIVSIAWDFGNEEDLKGYRVFRGEDLNQEFRQLTTAPIPGNYYSDTLALNTLKNRVFYKVKALDYKYNSSLFSEVLVLERPDFVAPVSPKGIQLKKQGDSLKICWSPSPSKDILAYRIYRKASGENEFTTIAQVSIDTTTYFDEVLTTNKTLMYRISAIDKVNNESNLSSIVHWNSGSKELSFTPLLSGSFNKKSKHFELQWDKLLDPKLKVIVYRNSGNGFKWHASVKDSNTVFEDDTFFKNNMGYAYKIQCMDEEGNLSQQSNIVQVSFK